MTVLAVGSVALDTVRTPFGEAAEVVGGSAVFFSASASHMSSVQVVGVVGSDYPMAALQPLRDRGVDFSGLEQVDGESFRWKGEYQHDLNVARTLDTRLGVFADFKPRVPEHFRDAPFVFLGNIDPRLQLEVLQQVRKPRLVACDTMNFWISSKRDELLEVLQQVDVLTINDAEARQLSGESNLLRAAAWLLSNGPDHVVIKKGEHGALMVNEDAVFFAPAYPLEDVFDPTGAGDSFAGGFIGYLARSGDLGESDMRRAVVYGSAMGSFAVEKFSIDRLMEVSRTEIARRVQDFHKLVSFEQELL